MKHKELVELQVSEASKQWIKAFNQGDITACAQTYTSRAVMDARPMGRYDGREAIYEFWSGFVNSTKATDLTYTNVNIEFIDENTAKLSASWSMNVGQGIISEELWVKENNLWLLSYDDFTVEEQF
jgi:ketosteroid isomerase-like protein